MHRLGILTRIGLIVLAIAAALQLLAVGLQFVDRDRIARSGFRLPLPDQAAAAALLIDRTATEHRTLVLRALTGADLAVSIVSAPPALREHETAMPRIESAIRRYLESDDPTAAGRYVSARARPDEGPWPGGGPRWRDLGGAETRFVIQLSDGGYVQLDAQGGLIQRVLGLPAGFVIGIAGFLVAGLAVFLIAREMRPLVRLARTVDALGIDGTTTPVPERGAREVRALIRAVNRMQARIAGLLRDRSFMLGALSHDLRTYLTRLRLRVEMIPDATVRERAGADIEDMQGLVETALAFAAAGFGADSGEQVDLAALVRKECETRQGAGAPVTLSLPAGTVRVRGKAVSLRRAVANLIDNAITYGGEATVTLSVEAGAACLRVEDRGPGIPAAERERVFEPFFRLEPSRSRGRGGAGLGLAIARQVVEALGGRIGADERAGGGACLWLTLPLSPDAAVG